MTAALRHGLRAAFLFCLLLPGGLAAQPAPVRLDDIGRGTLLFRGGEEDGYALAPEVKSVVEIGVAGPVARTIVRQLFANPGQHWMEGVYVFPLPESAAVDTLKLRVGDRLIEGRIDERRRARQTYETARAEGRKAALLEAERPNIFTAAVANIGPGETVAIEIQYQERLRLTDGEFRLRFPMVVGPRYTSGGARIARFAAGGWALPDDVVADAGRITPPVRHPAAGPVNPLHLTVRLRAGFPLAAVTSHHHEVRIEADGEEARTITLKQGAVAADRDFELTWRPEAATAPAAGLFYEDTAEARYLLAMLMPPTARPVGIEPQSRELIFILDTSGSMAGQSIAQARAALLRSLDTLRPQDRFNVIAFASDYRMLYPTAMPATAAAVGRARGWIAALQAEGGTEMAPALAAALADDGSSGRLRQVVFLTDGAVGNERTLFQLIRGRLGDSRLFTVGIGSAPNSHFMRGAARAGRGSFVHIGSDAQVAQRIDALTAQLRQPVLTDITVSLDDPGAVLAPAPIPDLYAGEPVVFTARLPAGATEAVVRGRQGQQDWRLKLPLAGGAPAQGIAKLWARERIAQREDDALLAEDTAAIDADILDLALQHALVTRLTSLVAVDVTPSRPADQPLRQDRIATNLPAGWEFEKVFGPGAPVRRAASPAGPAPAAMAPQADLVVPLPRTATPARLHLLIGLVLLLVALALVWVDGRPARSRAR